VLSFIEEINQRNQRRPLRTSVVIPVAVRVEAGWDRTARDASLLNRLARARDVPLDGPAADRSVQLRRAAAVSVVDATVGQAAEAAGPPTVILTSDVADVAPIAGPVAGRFASPESELCPSRPRQRAACCPTVNRSGTRTAATRY
jgi:hypothetical protein